jgi:predicted dehydrogenase/NADPH:quinone reductase-like Zn-dependent oxidoreductase
MQQVFQQSYLSKTLCVEEVPAPVLRGTGVLVQTAASLISPGTERAAVSFARKGLVAKVLSQPERIQLLLRKMKQVGVMDTVQLAKRKLENPIPLGYSAAGVVIEASADMPQIRPGDRVACAGAQFANHAEVLYIPKNLCVKLPDGMSFEEASFVAPGAIALHGVRQAQIGLGETILIIGLGLIGQLTAQLVRAQGGIPIGVDLEESRLTLARELGIMHALNRKNATLNETILQLTHGHGADVVLITAATPSQDPIILAGELCRERGKVVVVGDVGLNVPRSVYYRKELSVIISRSYGPGRYDENYETHGQDYPASYVRWTERDNMSAFLQLVAEGKINLKPMIDHRIPIAEAAKAYDILTNPEIRPQPLGIVLTYPEAKSVPTQKAEGRKLWLPNTGHKQANATWGLSVIGAGNFLTGTLLPLINALPQTRLRGLVSRSGLSAKNAARQAKFAFCSTDVQDVLHDEQSHAVLIATRHDSHAELLCQALAAGKHVFVEKPLATHREGLQACIQAMQAAPLQQVMVGYNRRFAPLSLALQKALNRGHGINPEAAPLSIRYRVLAGHIPDDSWLHQHGGRIIGELCHFVDWCQFITGEKPLRVSAQAVGEGLNPDVSVQLEFSGGSVAQIWYGMRLDTPTAAAMGKERIEVSAPGLLAEMEDFKSLKWAQGGKISTQKLSRQDKGHAEELRAWVQALTSGQPAIALESLLLTCETTFAVVEAMQSGDTVDITLDHYQFQPSGERP